MRVVCSIQLLTGPVALFASSTHPLLLEVVTSLPTRLTPPRTLKAPTDGLQVF